MSTLSNQERHALEDVFLSISSSKTSLLKNKISYYHAYFTLHLKARVKEYKYTSNLMKKMKKASEITFLQKNSQKT
jgi:hypothetical protein